MLGLFGLDSTCTVRGVDVVVVVLFEVCWLGVVMVLVRGVGRVVIDYLVGCGFCVVSW